MLRNSDFLARNKIAVIPVICCFNTKAGFVLGVYVLVVGDYTCKCIGKQNNLPRNAFFLARNKIGALSADMRLSGKKEGNENNLVRNRFFLARNESAAVIQSFNSKTVMEHKTEETKITSEEIAIPYQEITDIAQLIEMLPAKTYNRGSYGLKIIVCNTNEWQVSYYSHFENKTNEQYESQIAGTIQEALRKMIKFVAKKNGKRLPKVLNGLDYHSTMADYPFVGVFKVDLRITRLGDDAGNILKEKEVYMDTMILTGDVCKEVAKLNCGWKKVYELIYAVEIIETDAL